MYEAFPASVYNEIRAFNDHVACCYTIIGNKGAEGDLILEVHKASGHIERLILDCYKFLNIKLFDIVITKFEKRTKNVGLSVINNGEFYIDYKRRRQHIIQNLKEAKLLENQHTKIESFKLYDDAYSAYRDLEDYIDRHDSDIIWAKRKFSFNKGWKILAWTISAILSGLISSFIPWSKIW